MKRSFGSKENLARFGWMTARSASIRGSDMYCIGSAVEVSRQMFVLTTRLDSAATGSPGFHTFVGSN